MDSLVPLKQQPRGTADRLKAREILHSPPLIPSCCAAQIAQQSLECRMCQLPLRPPPWPRNSWTSPPAWAPAPTRIRSAIRCCWSRSRSRAMSIPAILTEADIGALIRHLRDAAFADRAARIAALRRRHRHRDQRRHPGRPGAASAAPRSERQPGPLGRIPGADGTHPLRRRVHRPSDIFPAAAGQPGAGRGRLRHARRRRSNPTARRRSPCAASSTSPPPPSPTAATRSTASMPR